MTRLATLIPWWSSSRSLDPVSVTQNEALETSSLYNREKRKTTDLAFELKPIGDFAAGTASSGGEDRERRSPWP